jgi:fructokinase
VIATADPVSTLGRVVGHLRRHEGRLAAIGIASFGPVDLDRGSARYGRITTTPKPNWPGSDVVGPLARAFAVPIGFDTDVNGAALAESRWGSAQGLDTFVYVTAGTGIGGGGLVGGRPMHGLMHPEMGHMRIPRHPADPLARGACPFHPDCWEGWAAKGAIERRWGAGRMATDLAESDLALLAHYLAAGIANVICAISPQRVVLGGGIVLGGGDAAYRERLLGIVRRETSELLAGYLRAPELSEGIERFLVAPALGADAGVLGGIALAHEEAARVTPADRPRT